MARNVHQRQGSSPLNVHLQPNTGIWLEVKDGIYVKIEAETDGSITLYNGGGQPFHIESKGLRNHQPPTVLNLSTAS